MLVSVLEANGYPSTLSSIVWGGGDVGGKFVSDKRVDLVSFTGSEARRRLVGMEVAGRFGKSLLELWGNNAAIVLPDANLRLTLRTMHFSDLGTSGPRSGFASTIGRTGDPLDPATLIGPLHSQDAAEKFQVTAYFRRALANLAIMKPKGAVTDFKKVCPIFLSLTVAFADSQAPAPPKFLQLDEQRIGEGATRRDPKALAAP
ncbi:hypothetical protein RQP46_008741 [Phenoliferia psychrophenolica]